MNSPLAVAAALTVCDGSSGDAYFGVVTDHSAAIANRQKSPMSARVAAAGRVV
jgi:hypothetical protein